MYKRTVKNSLMQAIRVFLSLVIPVKKGKVMLQSYPDYSDNARAFSDYLLTHTDLRLIWSVTNAKKYTDTERIRFIETDGGNHLKDRLSFIYHTVSSQFLFSTHGAFWFANKRKQTFVCMWHGVPLKKIALLQNSENKGFLNNTSYILSTSKFYIPIYRQCFDKKESEIPVTGIPRNDWLFEESDVLEKLGVKKNPHGKLIVYLPTFRKTGSEETVDSNQNVFKIGVLDFSSDSGVKILNEFLKRINVTLIVKPHPSELFQPADMEYSNIMVVPHAVFAEKDIQLNKLLHYADALITDFSSVFIDYMNLDRPIGFVLSDISEYSDNRGFIFDKPLEYMPGKKISNEEDFERFCMDVSEGKDEFKKERKDLQHVYNDYSDANNCERLFKLLKMQS